MPAIVNPPAAPPRPTSRSRERQRSSQRRSAAKTSDASLQTRTLMHQHQALMRMLPAGLGVVLIATLIITAIAPGLLGDELLYGWLAATVSLTLPPSYAWWRWKRQSRPKPPTRRQLLWTALSAGLLGLVWISAPAEMFNQAAPAQQWLLASAMLSLLGTGSIVLAAVPRAAVVWLGSLSLGLVYAFAHSPGLGYGAAQWLLYLGVAGLGSTAWQRALQARASAEARAEHQNQLISLLLRDFEDHGSDVLWEIDAKGRLIHVSKRLADALRSDIDSLNGRNLRSLLTDLQRGLADNERESANTLHERLTEGQPFRDVLLPLVVKGQSRWWSVTAKPLLDERGSPIGWRGVSRDVTQSRQADRRLAWLAHFDALTSLNNRAHFRVLLEQALQPNQGRDAQGAVLCLDLDNFKSVNDTLGHATGDALLVEVAQRLKSAVAKTDVVARLGGDEFAVLLRHFNDEESITQVCDRIIATLQEPCQAGGASVQVRTSIGIARFTLDGSTVDEVMQNADLALYDAKAHTPGGARFFATRMGETVRRRLVLERDLREAMARGQLSLHFQPKVDLRSWEIQGFEALLRWKHPEHGDIPPNEFIPVAEESGLILPMGEWALMEACRQAATWPLPLHVAVNISPVQVMTQDLPQTVLRALQASHLPAERLELEITESVFINESRGTVERLHALRRLGVQIALDDFGTGYSSLAYLRRFPFDTLKIDRAFVRELLVSRDARSIVRNILALAKSLRMTTVAEGVEEPAQVNVLEAEGCDLVQGYFVARPLPADQVVAFVEQWFDRDRPQPPRDFQLGSTEMADFRASMPMVVH
jgi:diguanylate cyclase (GGDEF)-like protein/PAS domain S-box-containing protein